MNEFHAYSGLHLAAVIGSALMAAAVCGVGYRLRKGPGELWFRVACLVFWVGWQTYKTTWWLSPERYDITVSLPLQLCDLLELLIPIALLVRQTWVRSALWLWGIGLSTQAFITPTLTRGPAEFEFWQFWVAHSVIVTAAVYDVAVRGLRIRAKDLLIVFAAGAALSLAMVGVNTLIDGNYFFLGNTTPERPTLVDRLGPWPWRAFALFAIAQVAVLLAYLPFPIARGLAGRSAPQSTDTTTG